VTEVTRRLRYAGESRTIAASAGASLIDVAYDELDVRSSTRACANGRCGSCRLLLDGARVKACELPWQDVPEGALLEAYETMKRHPAVKLAVAAFTRERPTRCRMCVGALAVTARSLADGADASDEAIDAALADVTCMCTGRGSLRRALERR
jgi:aerobic-type carbon monoxide dehydrogenase small subunit (CoxS/CutS family)